MAGKSTISITFKLDGDGKGFKALTQDANGLKKVLTETISEAQKLNTGAINFAAITTGIDQAQQSILQLQSVLKGLTDAHAAQIEAETKLAVNMRNTMGARQEDIQSIKDLCAAQQELGVIGDEVQLAGAQELATYLSEKQSLEQLIPVMNDMLAQQYGLNASQENAAQIATMLGKVMDGQTGALKRYGYSFDDAQEQILKYGTEAQRAAVLCDVVSSSVGGMNAKLAQTDDGKQKQLENTIGDLKEELGGLVQGAMPFVTIAANTMLALAGTLKFAAGVKTVTAVVAGWNIKQKALNAVMFMGTGNMKKATQAANIYSTAAKGSAASTTALKTALRGLLIGAGIGIAIAALTSVIGYFVSSTDDATDSTNKLLDAEERAKRDAEQLEQLRRQETSTLTSTRAALEINISKLKEFNGTKAEEKKLVTEMNDTYGDTMGYFSSVADWYNALISNSEAYCRQMVIEARTRMLANQIAEKEQETHDLLYDDNGQKKKYSTVRDVEQYISGYYTPTSGGGGGGPQLQYSQREIPGTSDLDKANAAIRANNVAVANLRKQMASVAEEAAQIAFSVRGSDTRPDTGGGKGATTEKKKTQLQQLSDLINQAKEDYLTASEAERDGIRQNIQQWSREKREIELLQKEAERPVTLTSFQDIDDEIAYQQSLRRYASQENLAQIDAEIKRLGDLRNQMEHNAHTPTPIDEIKTYEQLNAELSYYTHLLETANEVERTTIQRQYNALNDLKKTWDTTLADLKKPGDISALNTIAELDEAISYYQQKQKNATGEEIQNIQLTIDAYEQKRKALQRGIEIPSMQREVAEINKLTGREYKVKISGMGFDDLTAKINELNRLLNDTENPVTAPQRKDIESLIATYEKWRKECVMTFATFRSGYDSLKGIGSGVESITDALEGNGNAWQTVTGIVDGFLQIYDGIKAIVDVINMMSMATETNKTATENETAATVENTAAELSNMGASAANTSTKSGEAIAEAAASGAKLPFPMNIIAIAAGVAAVISALSAVGCFASGGIVGGNSMSGDKLLARVNSGEMILNANQQKNLFRMLNTPTAVRGVSISTPNYADVALPVDRLGGMLKEGMAEAAPGHVEFEIRGDRLYGVLRRYEKMRGRS